MLWETEFGLVQDTLKKSRVQIHTLGLEDSLFFHVEQRMRPLFGLDGVHDISIGSLLGDLRRQTVYRFKDNLSLSYLAFLPEGASQQVVVIGPFLYRALSRKDILEICEENGFPPANQQVIDEYYSSVPVIPENSPTFLLIDAFCERMWNSDFSLTDISSIPSTAEQSSVAASGKDFDDTFLAMKNMEIRYQMENEIMDAVMLGAESKLNQLLSLVGDQFFEKRAADPLRNAKNYCIIMNTLLRKAAERGGVHPIYLDRLSSRFALSIEQLNHSDQIKHIMADMFRSYCQLVKKNSIKSYSAIVQKAILAIESDPSVEMNLHKLAEILNISNVYLSSIFKKETGKTVTEYIREKRLSYAEYLLEHTNLQIQTVALHCGMLDVHYFSKQFKHRTGKTPTAFRADKLRRNFS